MKRAIVLLSGGLDSATTLYLVLGRGVKPHCLIFDYGQRHGKEIRAARKIAKAAGCSFEVLKVRLPQKSSALLDKRASLPQKRRTFRRIPATYVPGRNTIFLSFALSYAESRGASDIFIGANAVDFSGYPDCRPRYYKAWNRLVPLATKAGVEGKKIRIRTPLLELTKSRIIKMGMRLGVPYGLTWSCYKGGRRPCGSCDSCILRAKGFQEAGVPDPLLS